MFSKVTSDKLKQQSEDILGVFTKTVTSLRDVIAKASTQSTANRAEAQTLIDEASNLDAVVASNSRVIGKIESLLKD